MALLVCRGQVGGRSGVSYWAARARNARSAKEMAGCIVWCNCYYQREWYARLREGPVFISRDEFEEILEQLEQEHARARAGSRGCDGE